MTFAQHLASLLLLGAWVAATGCRCSRQGTSGRHLDEPEHAQCATTDDCIDLDPCRGIECIEGRCQSHALPPGTECGEATLCADAPRCTAAGNCVAGEPIAVDDLNPCTEDSCDPTRGVVHAPLVVDDGDACTLDACDPTTGTVTHEPVELDDGDECTFDTCNPETGVSHARVEPKYTCAASCGAGFYAASRRQNPSCPDLQTFCQPICGPSLYTCENSCPRGYQSGARHVTKNCGPEQPLTFCHRTE